MMKILPFMVLAIMAAAVVAIQPVLVYSRDDFTVAADQHKVFTYGFPFPIHDSPYSAIHTPKDQVRFRLAGNFAVWFAAGTGLVILTRKVRARRFEHQHE
jgi:hypothetical protein